MALSTRHRVKLNAKPQEHKQWLVNMPLDALIEIFLFLEPLDLLHLARTTKGLRAFLLSRKKSSALWKNVIGNLKDFPPCPDHMTAPAYTHLAFVPVCHGCFCPCETIEWELRMRCCPDCFPEMTISRYAILRSRPESYLTDLELPLACTHYELDYSSGFEITVSLKAVPCDYSIPIPYNFSFSVSDWEVAQSRKRPKNGEALKAFLAEQKDFWRSIQTHARLCQIWEYGILKEKAAQLSLVRSKRVEDIKDRLKDLGWIETGAYSCYRHDFLQLPQVRKPEPLTPVEWTKIRPQLISWLQKVREELICHQRMNIFKTTFLRVERQLGCDTPLKVQPLMIDIAKLPAVRSVIESNIDSDMSHDDLKRKFSDILPPAIRKWSADAVEELEQFTREELSLPPKSKPSCLPSVIFRCKVCTHRFRFDEALCHQHLYKENRKVHGNTRKTLTYDKLLMGYRSQPRDIRVLRVDVNVSRRVENLVRRVGRSPSRITYHQLCRSTVGVVCNLCRPKVATKMGFEQAFQHCLDTHVKKKETEVWTRVSAREREPRSVAAGKSIHR